MTSAPDARRLNDRVSVLIGDDGGRYPSVNSLVVRGDGETAIIDPSVTIVARGGVDFDVDAVINSHGHEDHLAGNGLFTDARVHIHHDDLGAAHGLDGLMDIYGLPAEVEVTMRNHVVEEFYYAPRPDASGFGDGDVFDLGRVTIEAMHLPGHTAGHSGFVVDDVFYLSDIDLTGFGPYYGDAASDLDAFEASLARARDVEAAHYVTSHHKGIISGRDAFVEAIDAFAAVIERRHQAMLEFLAEPHTIEEMAEHRFIYRPHVEHPFAGAVEHRSATLHVDRMLARGEVTEVEPGRFHAGAGLG